MNQELTPYAVFTNEYEKREAAFAGQLPAHIPAERFKRVVLRAVQKTPDLLVADRASLLSAAMDAATDGLLPDGREGAIVVFNTKVRRDGKDIWIKKCQWMPMLQGLLKKVRNSGELRSITVELVYGGDAFRYWVDEGGPHLNYEAADRPNKDEFRRAFAVAVTKDGSYIEVMDAQEIDDVQSVSRSKDREGNPTGPWRDWWGEMVKKTVLRRLIKRLPLSTDLDDLIRRDDALYDLDGSSDKPRVEPAKTLGGRLDQLADQRGVGVVDTVRHDADGVILENESVAENEEAATVGGSVGSQPADAAASTNSAGNPPVSTSTAAPAGAPNPETPPAGVPSQAEARAAGAEARAKGRTQVIPVRYKRYSTLASAFMDGYTTGVAEDREPGADEEEGQVRLMD